MKMYTSAISCIVSTVDSQGRFTHKIIIPNNAESTQAAARKTLTFLRHQGNSEVFSDLGLSENWTAFNELSGIY